MKIINKTIISFFIISGMAHADTLDYRHEYVDNGKNKDRIKLTHKFDSGVKFSVEARWKGDKKP
ncbi:TPA: oligogalacturonate-specific porin KdgM family protein, partial [Salmonella enterica subsp. diarizonae serovar 50:k:z35]